MLKILSSAGRLLGGLKSKGFIFAAFITALGVALPATYYWGYAKGEAEQREVYNKAILTWQNRTVKALEELEQVRAERDEAKQEKIEVIRYVKDPTGCADTPVPDGISEQLRE